MFKAGLEPHKVATVLLTNFNAHNFSVDISRTLDKKLAALAEHRSQIADMESTAGWVRQMAAQQGAGAGCQYAETFVRLDLR